MHDEFPWIELAAKKTIDDRTFMVRNHFVRADEVDAVRAWREQHNNIDLYVSVCRFAEPTRKSAYICDFFLDIDAVDLKAARQSTLLACKLLHDRLGIGESSFDIAFSGTKGFHICVPRVVWGNPEHQQCMRLWQVLAQKLNRKGVEHIDMGVYQVSRILRLANSIHSTTGLHKYPLDHAELLEMSMDQIIECAHQSRDEDDMSMPEESPKAMGWFVNAIDNATPPRCYKKHGRGWCVPSCVRAAEHAQLQDGSRHHAYFAIARSYAAVGATPEEIHARLKIIDERNPIDDSDYIQRIAFRAQKYGCLRECSDAIQQYCPEKGTPKCLTHRK